MLGKDMWRCAKQARRRTESGVALSSSNDWMTVDEFQCSSASWWGYYIVTNLLTVLSLQRTRFSLIGGLRNNRDELLPEGLQCSEVAYNV